MSNIHDMLSNILDGDSDQARESFNDIMREKVLDRIDAIRHEIGQVVFNKDEYVTEDWSEDDVYLNLNRVTQALKDIATINESWDELPDEDKEAFEDDDWEWDPLEGEEPVVEHVEKRHLKRYNEMYRDSMDAYRVTFMESLKPAMKAMVFADLREEVKPIAIRMLVQVMEDTYDAIAELPDDTRDTIAESVTELFQKILPEELSLVPMPAGYKKKGESKSEADANRNLAQGVKKNTPKPSYAPVKEDIEQLDELSKKTLNSYAAKAAMQNFKAKVLAAKSGRSFSPAEKAKMEKRARGVDSATYRTIYNRLPTAESVELEETEE